jgi:hypothetical protein
MKRLLAALTLALLLSLVAAVGTASATHSEGQGPNKDFVNGTAKLDLVPDTALQIHVNAQSAPDGTDPQGYFFVRQEGFFDVDIRGTVTCLNVNGNRAVFGGVVEQSRLPTVPEGRGVLIEVQDNGEPNEADRADGFILFVPPTSCPVSVFTNLTSQGNFVVHDATL